jgi:hypothetical protein
MSMSGAHFTFVPFGQDAGPDDVCCDGLVDGAALHLSHWPGNRTPAAWKRDTSVEIALAYARSGEAVPRVVNNHFDTDGVLAVFGLLEPEIAEAHADVLIAAAEVGDFGDWPRAPQGFWLDAAIASLAGERTDAAAYAHVLPKLPALLAELDRREDLWGDSWRSTLEADARAGSELRVVQAGPVTIFHHVPGAPELPTPLLSKRAPAWGTRWLRAFEQRDGSFHYRYELPPHAWADTVTRPMLRKPSRNAIAAKVEGSWALKGELGMVGLLRTREPLRSAPEAVAARLLEGDAAA